MSKCPECGERRVWRYVDAKQLVLVDDDGNIEDENRTEILEQHKFECPKCDTEWIHHE